MTADSPIPRRGSRDNGLRCGGYSAIADLDPRIADALLDTLRDAGIAAYAAPTPGAVGGYGELRLPSTPTDRLWVDDAQVTQARGILAQERETHEPEQVQAGPPAEDELDFEAAWQQVLTSLQATPSQLEDGERLEAAAAETDEPEGVDPADEDHFVPPPPPPLPRPRAVTFAAIASIAFGLFLLATGVDGGSLRPIAVIAIIGGSVSLVWNMRQGPPTDSGWDDGAVV